MGIAGELIARGFQVVVEPLLDITPVPGVRVSTDGIQAILATSGNGIRALAGLHPERHLPVWAVGDASARVARQLGYAQVTSAGGDVASLAALVGRHLDPRHGALLYAAGTALAGDLSGLLSACGFAVRRAVLYQTVTADHLSEALTHILRTGALDVAVFFSPRTAATFARLAEAAGVVENLAASDAYALSSAVAEQLAPLPWRRVIPAAAPTQAALLAALDRDLTRLAAADPRQA